MSTGTVYLYNIIMICSHYKEIYYNIYRYNNYAYMGACMQSFLGLVTKTNHGPRKHQLSVVNSILAPHIILLRFNFLYMHAYTGLGYSSFMHAVRMHLYGLSINILRTIIEHCNCILYYAYRRFRVSCMHARITIGFKSMHVTLIHLTRDIYTYKTSYVC